MADFKLWLCDKLLNLNSDVDLDVFVSYITGILETDSSVEDKTESLLDIIAEILPDPDDSIDKQCSLIMDKWNEFLTSQDDKEQQASATLSGTINTALHSIIEQQTAAVPTCKKTPISSATHKQAILAQYADVSDGEDSDTCLNEATAKSSATSTPSADSLVKNVNALMVKDRERAERDRAKQESESKRHKDKEDREKQKQKVQDRKDNEKKRTQKGEKKR